MRYFHREQMVDMINAGKTFLGKKKLSTIVWAIYEARTDTWFKHWLSSEGLGCITGIKPPCPSEEYDYSIIQNKD